MTCTSYITCLEAEKKSLNYSESEIKILSKIELEISQIIIRKSKGRI